MPDACTRGKSPCFATADQPPFAHALAGKPASVMARAMAETLVRSESKVTRTVAAWVSTADSVTPGTFSSAFSIVMLHVGQVMFAASSTTVSAGVAPAVPAHMTALKANVHLRIDHLLQEPDHVLGQPQQQADHDRPQPTPAAPASHGAWLTDL